MFEEFSKLYCPHCNTPIDTNIVARPKRCSFCNGIIWYRKAGTMKGLFEFPDLPLAVRDIVVIILLISALLYAYFYKFG